MQDRWIGISYYQFPSFQSSFQRDTYEQWYDYLDDIEDVVEEQEGEEDCAWIREANTCLFTRYSLLL